MSNKSFLITSTGRTGTQFLSRLMNKSKQWMVKHQPCDLDGKWDDSFLYYPYNWKVPAYIQNRFNQAYYGEVNGLLRYWINQINVGKKGIIYRNYKDVITSFANGKFHQEERVLLRKVKDINLVHTAFYRIARTNPDIFVIDFDRLTSDVDYILEIFSYFGIDDVKINKDIINKRVGTNPKVRSFEQLPKVVQDTINNLFWVDYARLLV